jgi:hypothetical protein
MSKMDSWNLKMNEDKERSEEESPPVNSYERLFAKFELEIKELRKESDLKTKELEMRLEEAENKLGITAITSLIPWRTIGSRSSNVDMKKETFQLPKDVYSILACWKWNTKPFWMSLCIVFLLQILMLVLLLVDQTDSRADNPLNLPANVDITVRIAQGLGVIIALFSQDDLLIGIEGFFKGLPSSFRGNECFQEIGIIQWNVAYMIRFAQGFLNLFASFILLMQAETVFDLLLNFLGVAFISNLDELAFRLGGSGYFGRHVKACTEDISQAEFHQDEKTYPAGRKGFDIKTHAHVLGAFSVMVIMLSWYSYFFIQQDAGVYSIQDIYVEFGDETLPYLGLFNGCYTASETGEKYNRRLVYEQAGFENDGGKFGFCNDLEGSGGWTFFDGVSGDPCDEYIVRSGPTNTFDLLEAATTQWYTKGGLPLEYREMSEILETSRSLVCGMSMLDATRDSCEELELEGKLDALQGTSMSRYFEKIPVDSIETDAFVDATLSHPIYVGKSSSEVILFTGRRWVLTMTHEIVGLKNYLANTSKIDGLKNHSTFFYNDKGFRAIEQENRWVLLVSEVVESGTDRGTPLGLQWYYPRYEEYEENAANYNFPSADLTRPEDAVFGCARCTTESNPCYFEGECHDETGTCTCAHGATGALCRDTPLGDGVCNPYFNTEEYDYDGGDCCGATCVGASCGVSGLESVYGIDIESVQFLSDSRVFGYQHCQDPDMATFTIERNKNGDYCYDLGLGEIFLELAELHVRCDDKLYLRIPLMDIVGDSVSDPCTRSYNDTIHVPYGASCELVVLSMWEINVLALYYDNDTGSRPIRDQSDLLGESDRSVQSMFWNVPASKCIVQTISNYSNSTFNESSAQGMAVQTLVNDGLSDSMCNQDPELLLERYALTFLNHSLGLESRNLDLHQCYGWGLPSAEIVCENDKVISLVLQNGRPCEACQGTIPTELLLLSHLGKYNLALYISTLEWRISFTNVVNLISLKYVEGLFIGNYLLRGQVPSELGNLQSLKRLSLDENALTGQIPSELGNLQSLKFLDLDRNALTGQIPSQLGNLQSLETLRLDSNDLRGSIPTELGRLQSLKWFDLSSNQLTGSIPTELGNLSKLTQCEICESRSIF